MGFLAPILEAAAVAHRRHLGRRHKCPHGRLQRFVERMLGENNAFQTGLMAQQMFSQQNVRALDINSSRLLAALF